MSYCIFSPPPALVPFVKYFWLLEAPATDHLQKQVITPDGCMEMIIHWGDPYLQFDEDGNHFVQPRSFVFGQIASPLVIAASGISGVVAARFLPCGFSAFSSMPVNKMNNRAVPLEELFGNDGIQLELSILSSTTGMQRIKLMGDFLSSRLTVQKEADTLARETYNLLMTSKGQITIKAIAARLQINRRNLERKLSTTIGLGPKQLSKIIRLQIALKTMERKRFSTLTELAHEGGYFDQAHFIKDFKEFTGLSPKQFYADSMKLSMLFAREE